jgi:hypothetical protein
VDSGLCTVASDATCFRSPNYPSHYNSNDHCTITVTAHEAVMLSVTAFDISYWNDHLTVAGVRYSGTSGPDGVQVAAGASITFTNDRVDAYDTRTGFEVCGACHPHIAGAHRGGPYALNPGVSAADAGGSAQSQGCCPRPSRRSHRRRRPRRRSLPVRDHPRRLNGR